MESYWELAFPTSATTKSGRDMIKVMLLPDYFIQFYCYALWGGANGSVPACGAPCAQAGPEPY